MCASVDPDEEAAEEAPGECDGFSAWSPFGDIICGLVGVLWRVFILRLLLLCASGLFVKCDVWCCEDSWCWCSLVLADPLLFW